MSSNPTMESIVFKDEALRDGLQMESRIFSLEEKLEIYRMLKRAGLKRIQVGSFVHPKIVPQMADTEAISVKKLTRVPLKTASIFLPPALSEACAI